jgi:hypothetical protein
MRRLSDLFLELLLLEVKKIEGEEGVFLVSG